MYLSKIEIIGFKSFAHRVNVNFDSGVTAIVGPNGCGKTNIVDAIRWALGEQRYSTLRSDKMEDVIFNGTKSRKPLGLAEVSLTIENTKGILPTEYSEVTITRRVFRSGESEYLLNKVPCRLKDILDLFMDTGMGSDAYSVIELKMVETILSDKAEERRKLFEEAAGVTKYKHRRKAAYRKLEDVQADLTRVNDIVKEVQKTVGSLERQAKKAEQYNDVSGRLKALEIDLLEREFAYLHSKALPLQEKLALAQTDKSVIDASLRKQEEEVDTLRSGLQTTEGELAEAQQSASAQFEAIHRVEEQMLIVNERLTALAANIARYEKEKVDLRAQGRLLAEEQVQSAERQVELRGEVASAEASYDEIRERHDGELRALDAEKSAVQELREAQLKLTHEQVMRRGEQDRLKSRLEDLTLRIDRSSEDSALYEADIRTNNDAVAGLTVQDRELRRTYVAAEMELLEREKAKKALRSDIDALAKESLKVQNELERTQAKIDFLKRMLESHEGFSEGTRFLLGRDGPGKFTTVADLVKTEQKYRQAVEAALGDFANCLVVETPEEGYRAVEELRTHDKGKASFICTAWIPKIIRRKRPAAGGGSVWAADVITCEPERRPLMQFLLDGVLLVPSLHDVRAALASAAGVRCVTLDGQTASSAGFLRGGGARADEGGLIGKKEQIAEMTNAVAALRKNLQEIGERRSAREAEHEAMSLKPFADAVKAIEKDMTSIEMKIAQLEFEKKRANDAIERNTAEVDLLRQEAADLRSSHDTVAGQLALLEERKTGLERELSAAAKALEEREQHTAEEARAVNELEIRVVTRQGDLRNIERDIERAAARIKDIEVTLERRNAEITHANEETERLNIALAEHMTNVAGLRSAFDVVDRQKRTIEQAYHTRRNELHQLELRMKDERRLHEDALAMTHDLEMKLSELRSSTEHLRLRAREEFELELQLKTYPEDEFVDFAHLRDEVKNLKDRIRVLGAINFAAFDEFTQEGERLNFLTQQRDDLVEAEQTLLRTIEEINTTAQRMFSETFAKIRDNFITIFKELFMEGDECDLRLQEDVDPLEANIEITAKPRGKRPTSIDLLSGGEKTLTAIALLFAIYLVKPSPFCILDEVDAPLDDSNIDRYTRILKKFANNTQFIVVTHNKRTMEAAQALYGVTMEEEGISKIVTVRFNEEARIRSATVTN
jgi:chromosome segregation protein